MEALAVMHYPWLHDGQFLGLDLYKIRTASALCFFFYEACILLNNVRMKVEAYLKGIWLFLSR